MKLLAHRGNTSGVNTSYENNPEYLKHAISLGWDIEIDARLIDNKMWLGHEYHLGLYLLAGWQVLLERGKEYVELRKRIETEMAKHSDTGAPSWLGNEAFHASHRSNLLRKNPTWFSQFGWAEPPDLPYIWPTPV